MTDKILEISKITPEELDEIIRDYLDRRKENLRKEKQDYVYLPIPIYEPQLPNLENLPEYDTEPFIFKF